jgi:DNA-binding IclR family transcriptional regulator
MEMGAEREEKHDPLMVQSVEKAFRILNAFQEYQGSMSLTEIARVSRLDKSAAQRFTHTLSRLGYLRKDSRTKLFSLTAKTLSIGYSYSRSNRFIDQAVPYLSHLSQATSETVNLTVLDDTEIIFVSRYLSHHTLNTEVQIGTRMPAYCTAPGVAMLSRLPLEEAHNILARSDLKPYTQSTTYDIEKLIEKLHLAAVRGYATAFEEFYHDDLSVAAAIVDPAGRPVCAINVAVSRARFTPEEMEKRFAPLVLAAATSISHGGRRI